MIKIARRTGIEGDRYFVEVEHIKRPECEYRFEPKIVIPVRRAKSDAESKWDDYDASGRRDHGFWLFSEELALSEFIRGRAWTESVYCNSMVEAIREVVEDRILLLWELGRALGKAELHSLKCSNADAVRFVAARVIEFKRSGTGGTSEDLKQAKLWLKKRNARTTGS